MIPSDVQSSTVFYLSQNCIQNSLEFIDFGSVLGLSSSVQSLSLSITPAQTAAWRKQIFQQLSERTKRELENFRHYEQAIEQVSSEDACLSSTKHIYQYWASVIHFWCTNLNLLSALYSCLYFCLWQLSWIVTVWAPCGKLAAYQTWSSNLYLKMLADSFVQEQVKHWSALFEYTETSNPERNICNSGTSYELFHHKMRLLNWNSDSSRWTFPLCNC